MYVSSALSVKFRSRKLEIVKYWNRLMGMEDDRLPKKVYKQLKTENGPWYREVKAIINFKPCSEYIINALMEKYATFSGGIELTINLN